ncbi:putative amidoligase domain-containing protein [Cohnella zeiphila]|uniref:PhiEco32-like amidoligase-type 2 protein n=1 Tax=Cohnella zeiphila TaxID=2761120 RepID=A0A7X0SI96_9BACL|nr:hypothetical protein [Cohnella zeiphila]MBB6730376.1 hypothetical protein [Cohnella zeiphila]
MSGSVWVWTGTHAREKEPEGPSRGRTGESAGSARHGEGAWWSKVDGVRLLERRPAELGEDDAVLALGSWPQARAGTGQAAERRQPWVWNAGADRVAELGPAEIARRLRREGFAAELSAAGPGSGKRRVSGKGGGAPGAANVADAGDPNWRGHVEISVAVFGLEAVEIVPAPSGFARPESLARRLSRASARALLALGLDLGTVRWRVGGGGRRGTIVGLTPKLRIRTEEGERRLREAAASFAAGWRDELGGYGPDVTVGADAEFVLVSPSGKVVPASRFFSPRAAAGSDSALIGGVLRWPLAELRPAPSREPRAVAVRLRGLLAAAARRAASEPQLRWLAGASPVRGLPLGGHLHISGALLTGERLRALDNAVALPLRLLEPPGAAGRRPRYGALGDFRPKPHGGFEYRTPPSWLVSPLLARGALALAKVAAEHARELAASRPLDDDGMRDAFYGGDRDRLLEGVRRVHEALRRTAGYAEYRREIEPVFRAIEQGWRWDETRDIRRAWRIAPY